MEGREEGGEKGGRETERGREGVGRKEGREAGTGLLIPFVQCVCRGRKNLTQSDAQVPNHG